jgi:hypothetical protein
MSANKGRQATPPWIGTSTPRLATRAIEMGAPRRRVVSTACSSVSRFRRTQQETFVLMTESSPIIGPRRGAKKRLKRVGGGRRRFRLAT